MKVLSIGSDRQVFVSGSEAQTRLLALAQGVGDLHLVVFALRELRLQPLRLSSHLMIYPTNSSHEAWYIWDAMRVGKKVVRPEVVTAQDPFESGLAAWRLAKYWSAKLQLQLHTDFLSPHFAAQSWLNRLRVYLGRFLLPKADSVRVVSQKIADSLHQAKIKIGGKLTILPVWIDVEKISRTLAQTNYRQVYRQFEQIILMACRLEPEKRTEIAIALMPRLLESFPRAGLLIVGSGSQEASLRALARQLGIENQVIFVGWSNDLISYYRSADLFLLTSAYEGYVRTATEAAACGLLTISTPVGGAAEAGAIICEPTDLPDVIRRELGHAERSVLLPVWPRWEDYLSQYLDALLS